MPFREVSKVGERHEFVMLGRHDEAFALNDSATFWYYAQRNNSRVTVAGRGCLGLAPE